jgi:hypothetical protein
MNIYRLDPINPNNSVWQNSIEKDSVWAAAPTGNDARDLVAAKTWPAGKTPPAGMVADASSPDTKSPWQDAALTSCTWEPTMSHLEAGDVVRADGSRVGE